jgi:hypothetical protein
MQMLGPVGLSRLAVDDAGACPHLPEPLAERVRAPGPSPWSSPRIHQQSVDAGRARPGPQLLDQCSQRRQDGLRGAPPPPPAALQRLARELRYWTRHLGVSEAQLRKVVADVGHMVEDVKRARRLALGAAPIHANRGAGYAPASSRRRARASRAASARKAERLAATRSMRVTSPSSIVMLSRTDLPGSSTRARK